MTTSQKHAARKFVERWTFRRGSEKGEDQQFWNSLLGEVLGMEDVASRVHYQVPVPMGGPRFVAAADGTKPVPPTTTKFLDAWIPETRVLIEHKSRGVNLDAPQAGHGGLTPYEQAVNWAEAARVPLPRTNGNPSGKRRSRRFTPPLNPRPRRSSMRGLAIPILPLPTSTTRSQCRPTSAPPTRRTTALCWPPTASPPHLRQGYGGQADTPEPEIVAHLFRLYKQLTTPSR